MTLRPALRHPEPRLVGFSELTQKIVGSSGVPGLDRRQDRIKVEAEERGTLSAPLGPQAADGVGINLDLGVGRQVNVNEIELWLRDAEREVLGDASHGCPSGG